jgi:dTDP-4-amino-4,6-dideoxygalactose transaminase
VITVPFLDIQAATVELRAELDAAVSDVLDGGWFVLGKEVEAFEQAWARHVGAGYAVGVGNGLDALVLGLRALGVGPGDEVVVPANTYIATWLAVTAVGATIVPVEPDPSAYVLTPEGVRAALTPATKAVLPVHLYGRGCDLTELHAELAARGIVLLEDGAQAQGAMVGQHRVGGHGQPVAWSFYPGKNLGALGDAGAVTCDDEELAQRLRRLRNYGSERKYENLEKGTNSRLDELQAALLRVKLRHLDVWNARRAEVAKRYQEGLADLPLTLPGTAFDQGHTWHVYVVQHADRDALQGRLAALGVQTLVHYPVPPHLQPAYSDLGLARDAFPVTERIHDHVLSLPMGPHLSTEHVEHVIDAVRRSA